MSRSSSFSGIPRKEFQMILFGATGWTGLHAAEYLAQNYSPKKNVRWAMAGRSLQKLRMVKERLCRMLDNQTWVQNLALIVVDSKDQAGLETVCARTSCVASCAGPFAEIGEPLLKACIESGSHYVDCSGETLWIQRMIEKYSAQACSRGIFIVPSCGFDSLVSDLGAFLAVSKLRE